MQDLKIPTKTETYDFMLKMIIIGDAGCGKSCLLHHFIEGKHKKCSSHTIGVEFGSKIIEVNVGEKASVVKLQVWDTAGQERYRSVTRSYYRGAVAALIVYDITSQDSFEAAISSWRDDARHLGCDDIALMLVGNKVDIKDKRAVQFMDGSAKAQEHEMLFLETSAITGENVNEIFTTLAHQIVTKLHDGRLQQLPGMSGTRNPEPAVVLTEAAPEGEAGGRCGSC